MPVDEICGEIHMYSWGVYYWVCGVFFSVLTCRYVAVVGADPVPGM
jgi:hypothetical protein